MVDLDADGADLRAIPAQRGSKGEVARVSFSVIKGRHERSDWTGVNGSVSVAADVSINWTDVQACAASDAVKDILVLCSQQPASSIIDKHNVDFLGSIFFFHGLRPADDRNVACQFLSCAAAAKSPHENPQVRKLRNNFLNSGDHDVCLDRRGREAGVAFVLNHHDIAGLCN